MSEDIDWNIAAHQETVGYYADRIMLPLSLEEDVYHLLLTDIPQTSILLIRTGCLPPQEHYIRLPALSVTTIDAYMELQCSVLPGIERSWDDLIKLAITTEELQDLTMQSRIMEALETKAKVVEDIDDKMIRNHESSVAQRYRITGKGARLLQVLRNVLEMFRTSSSAIEKQENIPQFGETGA
jgi:hypothetical protein